MKKWQSAKANIFNSRGVLWEYIANSMIENTGLRVTKLRKCIKSRMS